MGVPLVVVRGERGLVAVGDNPLWLSSVLMTLLLWCGRERTGLEGGYSLPQGRSERQRVRVMQLPSLSFPPSLFFSSDPVSWRLHHPACSMPSLPGPAVQNWPPLVSTKVLTSPRLLSVPYCTQHKGFSLMNSGVYSEESTWAGEYLCILDLFSILKCYNTIPNIQSIYIFTVELFIQRY